MAPPRIRSALSVLLALSSLSSALQVTSNSPCAPICQDQSQFDVSAPASSNTRNSDIVCPDRDYASTPAGRKFKDCMTCLQQSTFSQGSENDQMWFLYNMRYAMAYCVFAYPNATGAGSTPCSTSMACGPLAPHFKHGLLDTNGMTTFSYCSADGGNGQDRELYEKCLSCISAEGKTEYQANYVIALEAGCLQQPAPGIVIGVNDTVYAPAGISIVDPLTLIRGPDQDKGLPGTTIAGIVGGILAFLLVLSAIVFVCYRKRKNRRARAEFEANRHDQLRHRHQSSVSFQCQTHAMSPRFWPGGEEARSVQRDMADAQKPTPHAGDLSRRSSLWKPHNSMSSYENSLGSADEKTWDSQLQDDATGPQLARSEKGSIGVAVPLHNIKTNISTVPRGARAAYNSPSDIVTPMSAASTRSTTALLPGIKPYNPAEYGVHGSPNPPSISSFNSPVSGTTASPLLRNHGWPEPRQPGRPRGQPSHANDTAGIGVAISVPPPPVPFIKSPTKKSNKSNPTTGPGAPLESWEIQTTFMPPPQPK